MKFKVPIKIKLSIGIIIILISLVYLVYNDSKSLKQVEEVVDTTAVDSCEHLTLVEYLDAFGTFYDGYEDYMCPKCEAFVSADKWGWVPDIDSFQPLIKIDYQGAIIDSKTTFNLDEMRDYYLDYTFHDTIMTIAPSIDSVFHHYQIFFVNVTIQGDSGCWKYFQVNNSRPTTHGDTTWLKNNQ